MKVGLCVCVRVAKKTVGGGLSGVKMMEDGGKRQGRRGTEGPNPR